ncbi:tetratricopeptide repeat-containing protein [Toxoplasma gondii GAB2-2007-GAL-DOM2]|uniref:Tetratricopeptide repeat-containing protein n=2 Tax=Toxoplasma gondii TaxID=5811 RepID=V5B3Q6_TOXGV|nr:tetratricopeptide repeat-containing protein [Toxoplasma gondii VEG]KFG35350.1 tetratricopeptide repeat-containing protein [Toxoplasma gondii GAB2-2007-GAL-DOM2]
MHPNVSAEQLRERDASDNMRRKRGSRGEEETGEVRETGRTGFTQRKDTHSIPEAPRGRGRTRRPTEIEQARFGFLGVSPESREATGSRMRVGGPTTLSLQQPLRPQSPVHFCAPWRVSEEDRRRDEGRRKKEKSQRWVPPAPVWRTWRGNCSANPRPGSFMVATDSNYLERIRRKAQRDAFPAYGLRSQTQRVADAKVLISAAKRAGDIRAAGENLYRLGVLLDNKRRWVQAREAYREFLACTEELKDEQLQALAHNCLGIDYLRCEEYEQALKHHTQQLRLADEEGQYVAHMNIGLVYGKLDKPEEAARHYRAAADIAAKRGNLLGHSLAVGNLALTVFPSGDLTTSRRYMQYHVETMDELFSPGSATGKEFQHSGAFASFSLDSSYPSSCSPASTCDPRKQVKHSREEEEREGEERDGEEREAARAEGEEEGEEREDVGGEKKEGKPTEPGRRSMPRVSFRSSVSDKHQLQGDKMKAGERRVFEKTAEAVERPFSSPVSSRSHVSPSSPSAASTSLSRSSEQRTSWEEDPPLPSVCVALSEDTSQLLLEETEARGGRESRQARSLPRHGAAVLANLDSQHHLGKVDAARGDYAQAAAHLREARLMAKKAGERAAEMNANVAYGVVCGRMHFEENKKRVLSQSFEIQAALNLKSKLASLPCACPALV